MKKLVGAMLALLLMAGCSSDSGKSSQASNAPKPPEYVTGRTAFQKLYVAARGWARDAEPYRLESQLTDDSKGKDGKAGVWHAFFGSLSQNGAKSYIWSGTDVANAPERGVSPGPQDTYNPGNANQKVFDVSYLKVDSDQAFSTAQKHGGDKLLTSNPATPIFYILDWMPSTNELIWHVIYGNSRDDAKLKVAVNASTGDFMHVEK
jgi:hypothetical protein